jgi:hypothetical protein
MREFVPILVLCLVVTLIADAVYMRGKYLGAYYPQWITDKIH